MVISIGRQEANIWYCLTIFCGELLKKCVLPTNQRQLSIWRPSFVMALPRYDPIHSKSVRKLVQLNRVLWGQPRQLYKWNNIPFPTKKLYFSQIFKMFSFYCIFKFKTFKYPTLYFILIGYNLFIYYNIITNYILIIYELSNLDHVLGVVLQTRVAGGHQINDLTLIV